MDELTAFLTARLDEVEATAKAAASRAPGPWVGAFKQVTAEPPGRIIVVADTESAAVSHHIERQEPARVLRDIAASRAIIAMAEEAEEHGGETARLTFNLVLHLSAARFRDHPDYRPEWAKIGGSGASAAHESGKALPLEWGKGR